MAQLGGGPAPHPSTFRARPVVDHSVLINRAAHALTALGVPAACFTEQHYLLQGLTAKLFAKHLRVFPDFADTSMLERILYIGIDMRIYGTISTMSVAQFFAFLRFLRSPEGRSRLSQLSTAVKLAKRGGGELSAEQVAWVAMFEYQRTELANVMSRFRRRQELEIAEVERQLRKARAARETGLRDLNSRFFPAGDYVPMTTVELNAASWNEYVDRAVASGRARPVISESSLRQAVETSGDIVRRRHVLDFLAQGNRLQGLIDSCNLTIGRTESVSNSRASGPSPEEQPFCSQQLVKKRRTSHSMRIEGTNAVWTLPFMC